MESKRGQITIFIFVGIGILIVFSLIFYISGAKIKKMENEVSYFSSKFQPIKTFVSSCVDKVSEEGLYFIGLQGGYYEVPVLSKEFFGIIIPYYWLYQDNKMPPKEIIERELSKYVEDKLSECVNFSFFEEQDFEFGMGGVSVTSTIAEKEVVVNVDFPLKVRFGSDMEQFGKFTSSININFNKKYDYVKQIINEQKKIPDYVPIGFIANLAYENNFTFENIELGNGEIIYTLLFNESPKDIFIYVFMAKYNWSGFLIQNRSIDIEPIGEQPAYPDDKFSYLVKATGENIKFKDYSSLFDIGEYTGLIEFVPKKEDSGAHAVMVKAYDDKKNDDAEIFKLNIIRENEAPEIENVSDQKVNLAEDSVLKMKVVAKDPDKDLMFYNLESSIKGLIIDFITGEINYDLKDVETDNYTITVIATDIKGESVKKPFNLEIKNE